VIKSVQALLSVPVSVHEVSTIGNVMVQKLSVLHKQKEASGGLLLANVALACVVVVPYDVKQKHAIRPCM